MQIITAYFAGQGYSGWQNTYHTYHSHFRIKFSYFIWIYLTENMRLLSEDAKYLDERKTGWILTGEFDA